jgi:hypothetical protein
VKPITVYLTLSSYGIHVKPLMMPHDEDGNSRRGGAGRGSAVAQEEGPYKSHAKRSHPS